MFLRSCSGDVMTYLRMDRFRTRRENTEMRRVVDAGIRLGRFDLEAAATMMKNAGVPIHVSVRVLAGRGAIFKQWSKK